MNRAMNWIAGLVAVAGIGTGVVIAQDAGKKEPPKKEAQDKEARARARAEREATFKKLFPTAKTSLVTALGAAEKESKGKAYGVRYDLTKDNKLSIEVDLLANDKLIEMRVDPDSGKASAVKAGEEEEEEDE